MFSRFSFVPFDRHNLLLFALLAGLIMSSLAGCTAAKMEIYPPTGGEPLGADEGLLVIHVETNVPIESIEASGLRTRSRLSIGTHLWIVRAGAGQYRWDQIMIPPSVGYSGVLDLSNFRVRRKVKDWVWDDEFAFDVEAGKINYPGQLIVLSEEHARSVGRGYSVRNRNHSAMAIRTLLETHGELIQSLPVRYSGSGDDAFLDYYTRMRDASKKESTGGDE